jgi:hypothetical protein
MLRILIVATLLFLVSATSVQAGSSAAPGEGATVQLEIGARAGAQALLQPAVRALMPTAAMHRTINGVAQARRAADGRNPMLALFNLGSGSGKPGLALPVSDSVSLGLRYQYLRREDIRLEVAKTGSLDDGYSNHKLVLRARWQF